MQDFQKLQKILGAKQKISDFFGARLFKAELLVTAVVAEVWE